MESATYKRMATCFCGAKQPSSSNLPFFEDLSADSPQAQRLCKHCGYYIQAHDKEHMANNVPGNRRTVVEQGKCPGFEKHGAYEFDSFYCGCRGWD